MVALKRPCMASKYMQHAKNRGPITNYGAPHMAIEAGSYNLRYLVYMVRPYDKMAL